MKTTTPLSVRPGHSRKLASLLLLGAVLTSALAAAPTVAELMELGVYSEETKGDIDAALLLYQQVVADANAGQALAAQAQFRLAICYDKKRDFAAATAAFEKLIRDYPQEKDLVSLASEYLADGAALLPAPWADGEALDFDLRYPSGLLIGFARYSVSAGELAGRRTWHLGSQLVAGSHARSQLDVDAASMKPIRSTWTIQPVVAAEATYANGHAEVLVKGSAPQTIDLAGVVYDNEEAMQLIRRLPLATGFTKTFSVLVSIAGGRIVPVQLSVAGTEKIQAPAGTFDCHKVVLSLAGTHQTFWFSTDAHRYLVKFEANGIAALLTAIKSSGPDQPVFLREPTLGYSITAPAGWLVRRDENPDSVKRPSLLVADDGGLTVTRVKVEPQKNFDPATMASVRAFADHQIAEAKKLVQEFTVRPDSWKETTVDGQPALSFVADQVRGNVKAVALVTLAFVDGNTVDISCALSPEPLDTFRPKFDALVASYRGK